MILKVGERLKIIKQIAGRMAEMEWGELDFTLRQFDLPISDSDFVNDKYTYALNMVGRGSDQTLLELYEYLFEDRPSGAAAASIDSAVETPGCWEAGRFRLFMSHVTKDKVMATAVKQELAQYGIDCFVAHQDIKPTEE